MKNITALVFVAMSLGLIACAAVPLPQDQREVSFVEQTNLKQKDGYNAAVSYLAKNLGDSNLAIKVRDPETATIITQIAFDCPELKAFLDLNKHTPLFNLEVSTKDNKARFVYEGLSDRVYNAVSGNLMTITPISSESQASAIKTCAGRHKSEIMAAMASKKKDNW